MIRSAIRALPQPVAQIDVAVGSVWCGPAYAACVAGGNYEISRAHGVPSGQAFKGAVFAAASAVTANVVGNLSMNFYAKALAYGATQGGLAVAQGGSFKDAFTSAVFSKVLGNQLPGSVRDNLVTGSAAHAAIGGTASALGGGKFANGAVTAAFVYAYNYVKTAPMRGDQPGDRIAGPGCCGAGGWAAARELASALARPFQWVASIFSVSNDSSGYYRHYTNELGRDGILQSGTIMQSRDGFVYLTRDVYQDGLSAQRHLALRQPPTGYFVIPERNVTAIAGGGVVAPMYDQPGGGIEIKVLHAVSIKGRYYEAFD